MANERRLIDVNKPIKETQSIINFRKQHYMPTEDYESFLDYLKKLPTVEAVEVVHGRWVDYMVRDWHCSECGRKVPRQVYFDGYCYDDKLNYCPNCGAKMDGD